jgi:histidine triad (HIT) family protein
MWHVPSDESLSLLSTVPHGTKDIKMIENFSRRQFLIQGGAALVVPQVLKGQSSVPPPQSRSDCVFCRIVWNKAHAQKLWEDREFLAFLDIKPINPGHTLLIPKQHFEYIFDLAEPLYSEIFQRAKLLAAPIRAAMEARRIGVLIEGFGVAHLHVHLVPINKSGELTRKGVEGVTQQEFAKVAEKIRAAIGQSK